MSFHLELSDEDEEEIETLIDALDEHAERLNRLGPEFAEDRALALALRMRVEALTL